MYSPISESDFRKKIRFGADAAMHRVYFFYGEEDYLKHAAIRIAKESVVSDPFDFVYIGASEYSEEALISALAAPPMFGAYRLVALSVSFSDLRKNEISSLTDILADVPDDGYTVVLLNLPADGFDWGSSRAFSATFKKLAEIAVPVTFSRVTGAKLNGWVSKHYSEKKVLADAQTCAYTVSYCGADMFTLASQIDKIAMYVLAAGRDRVTQEDIRIAGCPVTEFDAFDLADAIIAGNHRVALEYLGYAKTQKTDPTLVMGSIARTLCDMYAADTCRRAGMSREQISEATGIKPYPLSKCLPVLEKTTPEKLRAALEAARLADAGIKGGYSDYTPIEVLICSL